jgi:hypothetical protein
MNRLYLIIGIGIILKYLVHKKNLHIALNVFMVGALFYFWYLPKEDKKEKVEIATDELLEEYEKLKNFEEDIGSNVGIKNIKQYLSHLSHINFKADKKELEHIADILETIRNELKSITLSIENDTRLREFQNLSKTMMTTLTKRYVDELFIYNKKNPYFPIDFDQPTPVNNKDTINNIFLPLLRDKLPSIVVEEDDKKN